jgi:hypothetical protein
MQNLPVNPDKMNLQEVIDAVRNLRQKLEENFIQLGQLFSLIKRDKLYKKKGYDSLKEFAEAEFKIGGTLAGKLCAVYDLYVEDINLDEQSLKEIGFDRLNMIKPFVAKQSPQVQDNWLEMAERLPMPELKDHIKQIKDKTKDKNKGVKDVLIDQYLQRMLSFFNCSRKELDYKLALYFQDRDLEEIKKLVKTRERQLDQELEAGKEDSQ